MLIALAKEPTRDTTAMGWARMAAPLPAESTPVRESPSNMRAHARSVAPPMPNGRRANQPTMERRKRRQVASTSWSGQSAWAMSAHCSVSSDTNPRRPNSRKRSKGGRMFRAGSPSKGSPSASPSATPSIIPRTRSRSTLLEMQIRVHVHPTKPRQNLVFGTHAKCHIGRDRRTKPRAKEKVSIAMPHFVLRRAQRGDRTHDSVGEPPSGEVR